MAVSILAQPLGAPWEQIGTNLTRGAIPARLRATSNRHGSDSASFELRGDTRKISRYLTAFTPIDVHVAGVLVWSGRVRETPTSTRRDGAVTVQCAGWQHHTSDDIFRRIYVHSRPGDYKDSRQMAGAPLGVYLQGGQVATEFGVITLGWPNDYVLSGGDNRVGVTLDLGPNNTAKRCVIEWESSNNAASQTFIARTSDTDSSVPGTSNDFFSFVLNTGASGTTAGTATTARRYVHLFLYFNAASATLTADIWIKLKKIRIFRDAAYESANASILKGDTILKDALPTLCPLLSTDTSQIAAGTVSLPHFIADWQTLAELAGPLSTVEGKYWMVDVDRRLVWKAKPTAAVYEIGAWPGGEFSDASANSGDDILNKVVSTATGEDGSILETERTQTGTVVDRRSFTRRRLLTVSGSFTTTAANSLGDAYLADHKTNALRGEATVQRGGVRDTATGSTPHPAWLLRKTNQLLRLADRIDPNTNAGGQTGIIDSVSYDDTTQTAQISLDADRGSYDQQVARREMA